MIHKKTKLVFYHNLLTRKNMWTTPKGFQIYGDHLINDETVESQLESMDTFMMGKIINTSDEI